MIPSFAFSTGILNATNKKFYQVIEGYAEVKSSYDLDITGGDILMLSLSGIFYMILVLILENLEDNGTISKIGSREGSIPYQ